MKPEFVQCLTPNSVVLKLNFTNGFRINMMFPAFGELVPQVLPILISVCGSPSSLFFGYCAIELRK